MGYLEDRMEEISKKTERAKRRALIERRITILASSAIICVMALIVAVVNIPKLNTVSSAAEGSRYGSLILTTPYMGYVIVGLFSFGLGLLVAFLCKQIRELRKLESKEE